MRVKGWPCDAADVNGDRLEMATPASLCGPFISFLFLSYLLFFLSHFRFFLIRTLFCLSFSLLLSFKGVLGLWSSFRTRLLFGGIHHGHRHWMGTTHWQCYALLTYNCIHCFVVPEILYIFFVDESCVSRCVYCWR